MKKDRVILIDGSSYFFRAYFAIQRLSNSAGLPTNAIYGFINMLLKVIDGEQPTKLGIAFDSKTPTFRKKMYPKYKANREAPPEDLVVQIPHIQRAVDCLNIFRIEKPGFEADDLIGTLTHKAVSEGMSVEIISADKDLMQLVTSEVHMHDTMKDRRVDEKAVFEKFGVRPDQMIDLLALMGDSSDNVPGVSGIGPKTAAQLLSEYETLDGLYANLDKIKQNKRRETLTAEKDNAYLSQKLVKLDCNVEVDFDWDALNYTGPNREALQSFFEEMEFRNLIKRFGMTQKESEFEKGKYSLIQTEADLKSVLKSLESAPVVALDTETTSLNVQQAELVGVSLSGKLGEAYYIPLGHRAGEERLADQLNEETARKLLKPFLEDPKVKKLGQNIKYDWQILRRWGVELGGVVSDTLLASYLIDSEQSHSLDALAQKYLNHQNISYEDVAGKGKSQISFAEVPLDKARDYAAEDADVTLRIHEKLVPELKKAKLCGLFQEVEVPLVEVLADMETTGVAVDDKRLQEMGVALEKDIKAIQSNVYTLAGEEFNLNSPKQLGQILFEKMGIPPVKKTKTGYSTDESVLHRLSSDHEIAKWILKNRELSKLKSTYVEGLLGQINPDNGRIHTHFNQTVAATGRLSSSNPNLQNIPVSHEKYDIRSVFIAGEGNTLFSADYSQVELRVLAHMSQDKELMHAFAQNEDVHVHTGRLIFGEDQIDSEMRRVAKTINFGVVYGQTPYGLSRQLGISTGDAKQFIDSYFERYSGVREFMRQTVETARQRGYVTTLLGRRRYVGELDSRNRMRREMAERTATNTPIQGTAADMIKVAMVRIFEALRKGKFKSKMILQVHDELVFEIRDSEKEKVTELVQKEMENALPMDVPLRVDVSFGQTWKKTS